MGFSGFWKFLGVVEGNNFQIWKYRDRWVCFFLNKRENFPCSSFSHNINYQFFPLFKLFLTWICFSVFGKKIKNLREQKIYNAMFFRVERLGKFVFPHDWFLWLHPFFIEECEEEKDRFWMQRRKWRDYVELRKTQVDFWTSLSFLFSTQYFTFNPPPCINISYPEWVSEPTSIHAQILTKIPNFSSAELLYGFPIENLL